MVLFDQVQLLDVAGPLDVFAAANDNGAHYKWITVSPGSKEVRTTSGTRLAVDAALEDVTGPIDTMIVPGPSDWRAAVSDPELISGIARLSRSSRRIASVCAGAFPLAATGILDGHRAATHWRWVPELAANFPKIMVDRESIFVRDGKVMTSAGVTAGIDLALSLVEEDFGPEVARATAKYLVVFMARPGGQSQFSVRLAAGRPHNDIVRTVLDAVTAEPGRDHSREALAALAGVSVRHLTRLFHTELGTTVARYAEQIRVEAAKGLLETGNDTLDLVARRSGFGSQETMRRAFQRELGITPSVYRARFRTTRSQCGRHP
ncbi:MAG: AraC family transcriptional regulator with amidase-like domain [Streptosporangiaceae bacterium]|jgi:transcriptional regulator GlxA family with amidase domain|nr:AraC family transcriptional regulator with amidase-like domain [Streptosporangiaceae bacterium]